MTSAWLADAVVVVHGLFVLFVVLGGLLVVRWPRLAWVHVPAAVWGALIEWQGWICPLTPLEVALRRRAGEAGYQGGFIENYVVPLIYPPGLSRGHQLALAVAVVGINAGIYLWVWRRWRRGRGEGPRRRPR